MSVAGLENSTFVHQCLHQMCEVRMLLSAGRARPPAQAAGTAVSSGNPRSANFPQLQTFMHPDVSPGSRGVVGRDNKGFLQPDEMTNSRRGRQVFVKGQETLWRATNRLQKQKHFYDGETTSMRIWCPG